MYSMAEDNFHYLVVFLIICIVIGLIIYFTKKRNRSRGILLIGCSNSGKTVLFTRLLYEKTVSTYMSMNENSGIYKTSKHKVKITDIPGNERIRKKLIDDYKNNTHGIVFVIDSESIQTELRDVAELLFTLLTDVTVKSNCKEILIACNKQNLPLAKGPAVIQLLLEKELNILRTLKSKQLDSTADEVTKKIPYLGHRKKEFQFTQLKPMNVTFAECVAYSEDDTEISVDDIKNFLVKF